MTKTRIAALVVDLGGFALFFGGVALALVALDRLLLLVGIVQILGK